jgi:hypothetical protein
MKQIPLWKAIHSNGRGPKYVCGYALVDDEDFDWLNQFTWHENRPKNGRTSYAVRLVYHGRKATALYLHREVLGLKPLSEDGREVDHIDHNGLNCQKENLRIGTKGQNLANRGLNRDSSTGYRGVTKVDDCARWRAQANRKTGDKAHKIYLGLYPTPEEAAVAYNTASVMLHGEHANPNDIPPDLLPSKERQEEIKARVTTALEKKGIALDITEEART